MRLPALTLLLIIVPSVIVGAGDLLEISRADLIAMVEEARREGYQEGFEAGVRAQIQFVAGSGSVVQGPSTGVQGNRFSTAIPHNPQAPPPNLFTPEGNIFIQQWRQQEQLRLQREAVEALRGIQTNLMIREGKDGSQ